MLRLKRLWVWAVRKRIPRSSWEVTEKCWFWEGRSPTKGLLCAPIIVIFEYNRSHNRTSPLQPPARQVVAKSGATSTAADKKLERILAGLGGGEWLSGALGTIEGAKIEDERNLGPTPALRVPQGWIEEDPWRKESIPRQEFVHRLRMPTTFQGSIAVASSISSRSWSHLQALSAPADWSMACNNDTADQSSLCHLTPLYQSTIKLSLTCRLRRLLQMKLVPPPSLSSQAPTLPPSRPPTHHGVGAGTRIGHDASREMRKVQNVFDRGG